jgi:small subunit ribosomal protein S20
MAITKGAKKAHRVSLKKRVFNVRRKSTMHDIVKKVRTHITKKSKEEAQALMPLAYKAIDKAAKRGIIKPNTAARKKSRLAAHVKKLNV